MRFVRESGEIGKLSSLQEKYLEIFEKNKEQYALHLLGVWRKIICKGFICL